MKRDTALICFSVLLFACGGDASGPGQPDAGPLDAAQDPNTPYEHAVLGSTWSKIAGAPTVSGGAKQDDVFFLDPQVGFLASGPRVAIYKTTDGGGTWNPVFTQKPTYFRSVAFVDATHGFAGNLGAGLDPSISDVNVLYETKDGGTTWAPVTTISGPTAKGICNLTVIDATHVVAVGRANGPSHLLSTKDAGATWSSIDLANWFSMAIDARFTSPSEGYVVGMNVAGVASIQRTTDGGASFTEVFASKTANSLAWKISAPSKQVGYVSIQDTTDGPATLAKTVDGGLTWSELPMPGVAEAALPAVGVGFITDQVGWVSPEDPSMPTYRTSDGGKSWVVDPALKSPINRFRFVDQNTAYAVGAAVWKLNVAF